MRFDRVLIADWSAASRPTSATSRHDAIWIAESGGTEHHFRTRAAAEAWLTARLTALSGQRVLLGFDFAFAWPEGFAAALTGRADPRAVWDWLAAHLTDGADNANNRFALADALNARFSSGPGPFWSCPATLHLPDLPHRRAGIDYPALGLTEHRAAERLTGAKPVWMLCNPGAVGSQSLVGQPLLARLAARGAATWPFDPPDTLAAAPLVLAEVYPSLLAGAVGAEIARSGDEKDRVQVRLLAQALAGLSETGALAALFAEAPAEAAEEGWILGARHAELLAVASGRDHAG
jgi:molybdopterin-guanine dinucleotide biosynthesis protein B